METEEDKMPSSVEEALTMGWQKITVPLDEQKRLSALPSLQYNINGFWCIHQDNDTDLCCDHNGQCVTRQRPKKRH
jgi:hypothetical protein